MNQHDRDSAELRWVCAECDEARAKFQQELERHRSTLMQLEQAKCQLRAMSEQPNISSQVESYLERKGFLDGATRVDAERYRKLRRFSQGYDMVGLTGDRLDSYIDNVIPGAPE